MLVLTLFSTLAAAAAARAAPDPTLATMTARLAAQTVVQPQFLPYWDAQCDAILALMAPNGSFTDIDYHFSQPALWPAYNHSKRCLLYTSPSPRDRTRSRMPSSA